MTSTRPQADQAPLWPHQLRGAFCAGTREAAPSIGLFDSLGGQQAHAGYRLRARMDRQARHLTALITDQHHVQHVARQLPRSQELDRSEEKPALLAQTVPARCLRARLARLQDPHKI